MTTLTTPQGRAIRLYELSVTPTYAGVLEGSPETFSKHYLKDVARFSHDAKGMPVLVLIPDAFPLPSMKCQARLTSDRGVKTNDPDFESLLIVRWFIDETALDQSINDLIKSILPLVDWEQYAKDRDITFW